MPRASREYSNPSARYLTPRCVPYAQQGRMLPARCLSATLRVFQGTLKLSQRLSGSSEALA